MEERGDKYSAESNVKIPLTARKYGEQAVYEVVVIRDFDFYSEH
jgi:hypothetical protein